MTETPEFPPPPPASPAAIDAAVQLLDQLRATAKACVRLLAADHADSLMVRASAQSLLHDAMSVGNLVSTELVEQILTPENIDKLLAGARE